MTTAIPGILSELGESEYAVLSSAYCKLHGVREHLSRIRDGYFNDGVPPTFDQVEAARMLLDEAYMEIEQYVLALSEPGEDACRMDRKAA